MSNKHTPGPWIVQGPHDAPWVATADHRTILPATIPDARLIAAAPDLLAALQACRELLAHSDVRHYIGAELGEMAQLHSALNASAKALAKATGE